jgi:Ca2+-transporting ATPase
MRTSGLTEVEAARRLAEWGPNTVPHRRPTSVLARLLTQLRDPLVLTLLAACALTVATGDLADTVVIALVVVANTTAGVVQEVRADRAVSALQEMVVQSVRVRRDGRERPVRSADLVPGDVLLLAEGDVVPADGEVLEASALLVDESALTGESVPVGHRGRHGDSAGDALSGGTVVARGRAVVSVTQTGPRSALGRIASLTDVRSGPTPLQRRMAGLGRMLAAVAVSLCLLVLVLGLLRGQPTEPMLVTAISLAVAAVPESLPAVVALSLAMGAQRMSARRAIVRRLPAVETLGSVTVLATDKTGTLTQAKMVVEELWTPVGSYQVTPGRDGAAGTFTLDGRTVDPRAHPDLLGLLEAVVLCNDARLAADLPAGGRTGMGDPTEVALLVAAGHAGLTRADLERRSPRVGEVPFDSETKHMTTIHSAAASRETRWAVRKGSPEVLADPAVRADAVHRAALREAEALASRGFRVLAVQAGPWEDGQGTPSLLGLVAMDDPAKPAARGTIAACRRAGIVPVLITGDHRATAVEVATRVGILTREEASAADAVATGDQIARGEVADLTRPRVFARTRPEQKLDIVAAWQARGAVVAMTGDGVNDGPALRRADIGVAMGNRGTEVARQAADMVLADDELATVEHAVEEGRRVYDNIRRFLVFGLSGGAAEILLMLLGPFAGLTLPLLAAQILWVNLLTHGLTGVAMGAEPADGDVMSRPPRPPEQSVLGDGLWQRVLAMGAVMALVCIGLGRWAEAAGRPWQTMVFLALTCMQLGVSLGLRARVLTRLNPWMLVAVGGSLALALAGVYVPVLQDLLTLHSLSAGEAALAAGAGGVGWVAVRASRPRARSDSTTPGGGAPVEVREKV